jgi:hypothetical protein
LIHPSHTTPDPKNTRADRTLTLGKIIRDRLRAKELAQNIHDDLVPNYLSEDDFFLALAVAVNLLK